jgi:hypothetical protein
MFDRAETPVDSDMLEYFVFEEEDAVEAVEQSRCLALAYPKSRPNQEPPDSPDCPYNSLAAAGEGSM